MSSKGSSLYSVQILWFYDCIHMAEMEWWVLSPYYLRQETCLVFFYILNIGAHVTYSLSLTAVQKFQSKIFGVPGGSDGKESTCNVGDQGSITGLGRSPGEMNGYPLQYSCLENSMDRWAWWAPGHGIQRVRHDWVTITWGEIPHLHSKHSSL